ncbi:hypothetical protein HK098_002427 [Nowakowskiella sp. JEL0407]|nr:hypothetical protein HK098_002427 [Nowakowskiella sp. JEL0407]
MDLLSLNRKLPEQLSKKSPSPTSVQDQDISAIDDEEDFDSFFEPDDQRSSFTQQETVSARSLNNDFLITSETSQSARNSTAMTWNKIFQSGVKSETTNNRPLSPTTAPSIIFRDDEDEDEGERDVIRTEGSENGNGAANSAGGIDAGSSMAAVDDYGSESGESGHYLISEFGEVLRNPETDIQSESKSVDLGDAEMDGGEGSIDEQSEKEQEPEWRQFILQSYGTPNAQNKSLSDESLQSSKPEQQIKPQEIFQDETNTQDPQEPSPDKSQEMRKEKVPDDSNQKINDENHPDLLDFVYEKVKMLEEKVDWLMERESCKFSLRKSKSF